MRALKPEELRAVCEPAALPFESTAELPALDGMIGQDRAMTATAFGIGINGPATACSSWAPRVPAGPRLCIGS
jgi:hypothetical protein